MRIIGYARVSSDSQAEGYSLDNQAARLRSAGCDEILVDVESAFKKNSDRPEFERLMQLAKTGQVDQIIVTNLDRLSRNEAISFTAFDAFDEAGVKLISLDQPYLDLSNPDMRVMAGYSVLEARAYSARLSRRVKQGHKAHRDRNAAYFPPFGYVKVGEKFELDHMPFLCLLSLNIELSRAAIARDLIEIFLNAKSLRKSLMVINTKYGIFSHATQGKGNRQPRGKFHFNPSGFATWLNNPILRGHICYGRSYQQRQSHKKSWDVRYNTHSEHKILSEQEYQQIEMILDHNAASGGYSFISDIIHPLSGLIYCSECRGKCRITNFRLRSDPTVKKYSYQCQNYHLKACTQKSSAREQVLEQAIIDALIAAAVKIASLAAASVESVEPIELKELKAKLCSLESLGYDPAFENAKQNLRLRIEALTHQTQNVSVQASENRNLLLMSAQQPDFWQELEPARKQRFYRALVDRVLVKEGAVQEVRLKPF